MTADKKFKVTCAGGANVDIQGFPNAPVVMRDSNPGTVRLCAGGVGRNIAENLAHLGADVTMVSAVGDDISGELIRQWCADAGMRTDCIETIPGASSSTYLVLNDHLGDMLAAISDMHIIKGLGADFIQRHAEAFDGAEAIVVDPNLSPEALGAVMEGWSDKPIFADPISTTYAKVLKQFLPSLYMVKCNRLEAEILADMPIKTLTDLHEAADAILKTGTSRVVITLGSDGVFYKDSDGYCEKRVHPSIDPVSATGAGDAFTGAMVYAHLAGFDVDRSLELAMHAAEITLGDTLTVTPKIKRLVADA